MAVHTWDRGGANSAWNRRPCSRRNYPEIFTRLPSPPLPPPRWFFSVGGAYLFSWQAAGKIANFASHLIQGLFIRAYEPCFFRILSSLSLSNFRFNVGNFTTREIRGEGIAKKIRKFVKMVLKCIFVYDNRWMKRCYDLKYFFDILRKCERTRRGLYSKTSLTEKRVRKEGTWNFSRSFFPPLINDFFSTSLLRASSRNYYTKRSSVVKIRRKKDVEIEKRERERERKFVMITERFNL